MLRGMKFTDSDPWISEWYSGNTPKQIWIGTTVENQARADERIPALLNIPARVRFLSCEPLLGPVDLKFTNHPEANNLDGYSRCGMDEKHDKIMEWVIAGGESGPRARPMQADWVRSLRDQCDAAAVCFFFKQWGEYGPNWLNDDDGNKLPDSEWMDKLGKKNAGRVLDGVTWDEVPGDIMQYDNLPQSMK